MDVGCMEVHRDVRHTEGRDASWGDLHAMDGKAGTLAMQAMVHSPVGPRPDRRSTQKLNDLHVLLCIADDGAGTTVAVLLSRLHVVRQQTCNRCQARACIGACICGVPPLFPPLPFESISAPPQPGRFSARKQ